MKVALNREGASSAVWSTPDEINWIDNQALSIERFRTFLQGFVLRANFDGLDKRRIINHVREIAANRFGYEFRMIHGEA